MNKTITIGNKQISDNSPVYIIAEAGRNHNGDLEIAKKLIEKAKECGADAVKFQSFQAKNFMIENIFKVQHVAETVSTEDSFFEATKKVELTKEMHIKLKEYADKIGIEFLSTPEDKSMADLLEDIGVPLFKIASMDLTYLDFLKHIAKKDKPMILSTGMSTLGEIEDAINTIEATGNKDVVILHCTSQYPPKYFEINLKAIETLKKAFGTVVGYSDHTEGIVASLGAVALGAKVIEKHFTLDKNMEGPDHRLSADVNEMKLLVDSIRKMEMALGVSCKRPVKNEQEMRNAVRRRIVAEDEIPTGTILNFSNMACKAAGTQGEGIEANLLYLLNGKKLKKDLKRDDLITWDIVE